MLYFITILLPPLGVLLTGRVVSFFANCLLTLCFYIPGLIHGLTVVADHKSEEV